MKISVIVPVYKVEAFLERCVKSILNQSYTDLEVVLIDDGSPDNCPIICDSLAERDDRIIVVHQNNKGLAGARNTGLEYATGEYVGFVDSDDWIELDTYSYCVNLIQSYNADVVQFQLGYVHGENTPFKAVDEKIEPIYGKDILQHYLYSTTIGKGGDYSVCVCLFKKELLEGVRFREGKINEDIDFKYRAFSKAQIMVNSNLKKYYYFQQNTGISLGGLCRRDFDLYDAAEELVLLSASEQYGSIRKLAKLKKARTPLSLLCKIAYYGISDDSINKNETVKALTKELRSNTKTLLCSPLPVSRKVLVVFFSISYSFTELLIRIVKRI